MFKLKIFVIALILSSCVMRQNPVAIEKGNNNANLPLNKDSGENPYSSYPNINSTNNIEENKDVNINNNISNSNVNTHTVVYGDTLYNISKRYDLDQNDLIKWNNIINNNISIGQILFIKDINSNLSNSDTTNSNTSIIEHAPEENITKSEADVQVPTLLGGGGIQQGMINNNQGNDNILNNTATLNQSVVSKTKNYDGIIWSMPTNGSIMNHYSTKNKGVDFTGELGSPVFAVADGKVVYAGSDLKGYGNLIIIQHNLIYLTAYANNKNLFLKEGDKVIRGQQIATMGNSDSQNVKLHFEVRKNGQAINPINFIPIE